MGKKIEGSSDVYASQINVDSSGNVYATGQFYETVDFDPGVGTSNLTSAGEGDIYILKLDSDGEYVWAKQIGGANNDAEVIPIFVDSSNNIYTTGVFQETVDFDPGAGTANLTSAGNNDIFISKLSQVSLPSLSATTTTSTTDSLTLTSSITNTGGAPLTERGFQYGTTESYGSSVTDIGSFDTGSYTTTIS